MPELPEVEEVRRTLEPFLLGQEIRAIEILRPDFLQPKNAPLASLTNRHFSRTHRHGKKLFLITPEPTDTTLVLHLGMSGRVDCVPSDSPIPKHTHILFSLTNGHDVRLRDPRRFGGLTFYPTLQKALAAETQNLGPDALTITPADLAHWKQSRARLKQRLLSQKDIAGLGNIYVDEALWAAKLHPQQQLRRLTPKQIATLVHEIHAVLNRSLASGGTTLRDYRNVSNQPGQFAKKLNAYGRAGQPCPRCRTTLKSIQITARTTVFCPTCQKRR